MKNKPTPLLDKIINIVFWIAIVGVIACVIALAYLSGQMYGVITGINAINQDNNITMCDYLNKTTDDRGYCILNDNAKYNADMKCPYGNYTFIGEKDMSMLNKIQARTSAIILYPALRCW